MYLTSENILFIGSILVFSSILITRASGRFGIPAIVLFLIVGMASGSDGFGIVFDNMRQAQFIGMIALSVILFTGGIETRFKDIKPVLGPGLVLSTAGVILTTLLTGGFIYLLSCWDRIGFTMPLVTCLLLAATMSSTDSASVFNILRGKKMNLKHNVQPILELESGSNDPMAYILTIVLVHVAQATSGIDASFSGGTWAIAADALKVLFLQFTVGTAIGALMGLATVWLLNKVTLNSTPLYAIMLLSIVFFTFSIAGMLEGNGYLAVYIAGIIIGNNKLTNRKQIFSFFDGITWCMQIGMFLMLGLLVNPHDMLKTAPAAMLIGIFMILIGRPASVFLSLLPFRKLNFASRTFISWVGLRGAVPIIFATYPVVTGIPGSDMIFNIVFFITLLSLVVQGGTIPWMAKKLDIYEPTNEEERLIDVDMPEEAGELSELTITDEILQAKGSTLREFQLPEGVLVLTIKRGEKYMVPNGNVSLERGERLLIISSKDM